MKALAIALGVVLLAAVALMLQPFANAEPAPVRVIDRTMVCAVGVRAGVRKIEVHARTGTRLFEDRTKWKYRASASVFDPSPRQLIFAWITAGWPPPREPGTTPSANSLALTPRCRLSAASVSLSTKGVTGGAASPLDDEYHCVVPRRIVVRVRSLFRAPTSLRENRWGQLAARGAVKEGAIAIRTESGKPVAFATVHESGKARLFVGDSCVPDLISSDG